MILEALSQGFVGKEMQSSAQELEKDKSVVLDALHRQETGMIHDNQLQEYINRVEGQKQQKKQAKQEFEVFRT